ncbi:MAG: hypothetical protein SVS85_03490, partial [Candidatus Nanohaloarchaea archaeon]|nr:hypothetical protein [Candidatus Nanohaloarchaea archaeon]
SIHDGSNGNNIYVPKDSLPAYFDLMEDLPEELEDAESGHGKTLGDKWPDQGTKQMLVAKANFIGDLVRYKRKQQDLSQTELADRV